MKLKTILFSFVVALCLGSTAVASAMSSSDFDNKVVGKTWNWKIGDITGTIAFSSSGGVEANLTGEYELELTAIGVGITIKYVSNITRLRRIKSHAPIFHPIVKGIKCRLAASYIRGI